MQENNFETIISTWRRLSGEPVESAKLVSMSGDTSDRQTFKKKEEETDLLSSDKNKLPPTALATVSSDGLDSSYKGDPEEKQEFLKENKEESKDASGDSYEADKTSDYLENKDKLTKTPEAAWENDKSGDKVDSVYLRPPPPHKTRSTASTEQEEDCGIKCLYYTLQCCDCVLM